MTHTTIDLFAGACDLIPGPWLARIRVVVAREEPVFAVERHHAAAARSMPLPLAVQPTAGQDPWTCHISRVVSRPTEHSHHGFRAYAVRERS